jgi:hypothetical protein
LTCPAVLQAVLHGLIEIDDSQLARRTLVPIAQVAAAKSKTSARIQYDSYSSRARIHMNTTVRVVLQWQNYVRIVDR